MINHAYKVTCKEHEDWHYHSDNEGMAWFMAGLHCGEYVCPYTNIKNELLLVV